MRVKYLWLIFVVFLVLGLGCQQNEATPRTEVSVVTPTVLSTPVPLSEAVTQVDLDKKIEASQSWKIDFIIKDKRVAGELSMSPYWISAWEGAQQAGEEFGVDLELGLITSGCQTDTECVEPQIRLVADLIAQGETDGLIIAPIDSNRLVPVVEKVIAAGIPTIVMDNALNTEEILTFIVFDNFMAGQAMGEWVVEELDGTGKALILEGPNDQQNAIDRRDGFLAGLQAGDIEILDIQSADWETSIAKEKTAQWLQEFSEFDVIIAANDNMALGAAQAVEEAKRRDILITGYDAVVGALSAIEDGRMTATIDQAPNLQAYIAVQLMVRHLEQGETFPPIILLPDIPLITKANVNAYLAE